MLNIFDPLKGILKHHSVKIDNLIFVLHYRATVLLLIAFCIAVSSNQYIGDPIHCIRPTQYIPSSVINSYCWIHATFTLTKAHGKIIDVEVPHSGVDKMEKGDEIRRHQYYQWVAFMLILQAAFFYVPRWLWKNWEGGKLIALKHDLNLPVMSSSDKKSKISLIATYFVDNTHFHGIYLSKFVLSEVLNLINVIGQIFLIDKFLGGEFTTYGTKVVDYVNSETPNRPDPMVEVFPRVTKCTFYSFGPSGNIQRHDTLCILPINIINEKIYVFMWFWFVFLAILSAIVLVYRTAMVTSKALRRKLMVTSVNQDDTNIFNRVVLAISAGDWFLLYMLRSNIDPHNFKILMRYINEILPKDGEIEMQEKKKTKKKEKKKEKEAEEKDPEKEPLQSDEGTHV